MFAEIRGGLVRSGAKGTLVKQDPGRSGGGALIIPGWNTSPTTTLLISNHSNKERIFGVISKRTASSFHARKIERKKEEIVLLWR